MTPEGHIKNMLRGLLKLHGAYQFWPVQTGFGADTLDVLGSRKGDGRFFAVEVKRPGAKPTTRQRKRLREIHATGAAVFVFDGDMGDLRLLESWLATPGMGADSPAEKLIDHWDIWRDADDEVLV